MTIRREDLAAVFGNPRLVVAFEEQAAAVERTSQTATEAKDTSSSIAVATVLVLSANDVFENERIVTAGDGIELVDDGTRLTVRISDLAARVSGDGGLNFIITGATDLILPLAGTLASLEGVETLSGKTLATPTLSGLSDYANDAAAAGGGVPVEGVYRNGSVVMVRVA
jgi:hypothetical protein